MAEFSRLQAVAVRVEGHLLTLEGIKKTELRQNCSWTLNQDLIPVTYLQVSPPKGSESLNSTPTWRPSVGRREPVRGIQTLPQVS